LKTELSDIELNEKEIKCCNTKLVDVAVLSKPGVSESLVVVLCPICKQNTFLHRYSGYTMFSHNEDFILEDVDYDPDKNKTYIKLKVKNG
jgi:hypothetical protein